MVIDTSALIAILQKEPEAEVFTRMILRDSRRLISVVTALEAEMVAFGRAGKDGVALLEFVIHKLSCETVQCSLEELAIARRAFRRFGKGRHPAGLNLGDCFPYALARVTGEPLLFKGEDFAQTDIVRVRLSSNVLEPE
jgi:ribonuclease VapC